MVYFSLTFNISHTHQHRERDQSRNKMDAGEGPTKSAHLARRRLIRSGLPEHRNRKNNPKSILRVESYTISIDGFGAGPDQSLENPMGIGGTTLHGWALPTRTFQEKLFGKDGGETGIDEDFAAHGFHNVEDWIMGRNMFGP